jgi:TolB-like protein
MPPLETTAANEPSARRSRGLLLPSIAHKIGTPALTGMSEGGMHRSANPLQLRLFGGVELRSDRMPDAPPPGRKVRALLAYLALSPDIVWPREKLMALLWSDRAEEQARASLRQALTELRHALGEPSPLRTEQDTVSLDSSGIVVDAVEFARLAKAGKLEEAAALYRGPLLDGHGVRDGAYEDWLRVERTRLHDLAVDTLHRLAASQSGETAIATAQRLLQLDQAREEAHRLLMGLYAAAGHRAQALRQYQLCRDALQRELQAKPDAETERLYRQIQDEAAPHSAVNTKTPTDSKPSIAVLPFTNMSGDAEQQYFSDGITEDIIIELSRNHGFSVIARNSSFQYRDPAIDVKRVGRELGVQYVVVGSIRKMGPQVRIAVQLVDAGTGNHLWAERYDRELQAIFAIQDELTTAIVAAIAGRVEAAGIDKTRRKRTESLAAYDFFLRGLEHFNRSGREDVVPARDMFARAIEIDPGFARAHALLAGCLVELSWADVWTDWDSSKALRDQAVATGKRAVALDGSDARCHSALVYVHMSRKEFDLAAHHLSLAAKLNPNDPEVIEHQGMLETYRGRPQEALRYLELAMRLNPTPPNYYRVIEGLALYQLRRYGDASKAFERATARLPYVDRYIAACYAQQGRLEGARACVAHSMQSEPQFTLRVWTRIEPYEFQADLQHLRDGMRKAGLPE